MKSTGMTYRIALALLLFVSASAAAWAQQAPIGASGAPNSRPPYAGRGPLDPEPVSPGFQEKIERGRQSDRQRRMIADTNRLLALASQLKSEVNAPNKSAPSPDDLKKIEEIEKLAHSVRERMKG